MPPHEPADPPKSVDSEDEEEHEAGEGVKKKKKRRKHRDKEKHKAEMKTAEMVREKFPAGVEESHPVDLELGQNLRKGKQNKPQPVRLKRLKIK